MHEMKLREQQAQVISFLFLLTTHNTHTHTCEEMSWKVNEAARASNERRQAANQQNENNVENEWNGYVCNTSICLIWDHFSQSF